MDIRVGMKFSADHGGTAEVLEEYQPGWWTVMIKWSAKSDAEEYDLAPDDIADIFRSEDGWVEVK